MSDVKSIFARNLKHYIEIKETNSRKICKDLNIPTSTFSNWMTGKIYPRMDKVELLAHYFGINKSDLVEEHFEKPDSELLNSIISEVELLSENKQKHLLKYAQLLRDSHIDES